MSLETMTKLATYTVGVSSVASYTFSNIPQNYTDLRLVISAKTDFAYYADDLAITVNGLSTTYSTQRVLYGTGANVYATGSTTLWSAEVQGDSGTSIFSNSEIYIHNYTSNVYKSFGSDSVTENNGTSAAAHLVAGVLQVANPITSLTVSSGNGGNFVQFSSFTLYGVKAMRTAVGNSIKATGGNIIFDGTYVYHVFNATGAFVPTQPLIADYLVVAGGGGGGWGHGAGGGAGGLRSEANKQLTPVSYAITVGAGGTTGTNYGASSKGTNGSDSIFNSITSTGGGAGGGTANGANANGNTGGSGGGGSYSLSSGYGYAGAGNTPSTSPSQGNNGGQGSTGPASGGGGGGAGGAGLSGLPGIGGIGSSAFSSWGVATGAGQNVSGTYYFAGGGGGGIENGTGASGGYGGGGAGVGSTGSTGGAGALNTGGGGGGGGYSTYPGGPGGAGGSGIVIIRYKA